jgi:hypothetical protein
MAELGRLSRPENKVASFTTQAFESTVNTLLRPKSGRHSLRDLPTDLRTESPSGRLLGVSSQAWLARQFGYDFSRVRVHDGVQSLSRIGARAVAGNGQIWFGGTHRETDRALLAHEATHLIQQSGRFAARSSSETLEREARASQGPPSVPNWRPFHQVLHPARHILQFDFESDALAELHRMPSAEDPDLEAKEQRRRLSALSARRRRLEALFATVPFPESTKLLPRLRERRKGDRLSERFHDMLHRAERAELIRIVEWAKPAGKPGEPPMNKTLRLDQTVPIQGLARDQPNYADRAFQGITSAPIGDTYTFYRKFENGQGTNGTEIAKKDFHLDADPLAGFTMFHNNVYRSKAVADQVLAEVDKSYPLPNSQRVAYYLRGGVIWPTTLSATTLPVLVLNLTGKRDQDRADVKATAELARQVLWWYVGARLGFGAKPAAGADVAGPGAATAGRTAPAAAAGAGASAGGAFRASAVAQELFTATESLAASGNGPRMIGAIKRLAAMNLSAAQKAEVTLEFFRKIGFATSKSGLVDEGAQLVMFSEDSIYGFRYIKATGEILYGKMDMKAMDYVWKVLR